MKFDKEGRELPDPRPVALPVGVRRPPSLTEQIKSMVRNELSMAAAARGVESFREANDFEVEEEFDADGVMTPYEVQGLQEEIPNERVERQAEARRSDRDDRSARDSGEDERAGSEGVQRDDVASGGKDRARQSGSAEGASKAAAVSAAAGNTVD